MPLIFAPLLPGNPLLTTAVAQDAPSPQDDAAKRLQWLKSKGLAGAETPAKPTPAPNAAAGAAILKKRFAETRSQQLRPLDAPAAESNAGAKKSAPAASEKPVASASAPAAPSGPGAESSAAKPAAVAKETSPKPPSPKEAAAVKETAKEKGSVAKTAIKDTPATTGATAKAAAGKETGGKTSTAAVKETTTASKGATKESSKPKAASTAAASTPTKEANAAAKTASTEAKKLSASEKKVAATSAPAPETRATTTSTKTAATGSKDTATKASTASKEAAAKTTTAKEPATSTATAKTGTTTAPAEEPAKKSGSGEKGAEKKSIVAASAAKPQPTPAPAVTARTADTPATRALLKTPATTAAMAPSQKPIASTRSPETSTGPHGLRMTTTTTNVSEMDERITNTKPVRMTSRYPWRNSIVTTVFWVGERPAGNNFTPNYASSWDAAWSRSYGGFDNPDPDHRRNFIPIKFTPRQNPFYVALPYNDVTRGTTKPESRRVIPWFKDAFEREGQSVCHNRWVAVRSRSGKIAYAQWSDCGPFRTDHWQYVFGNERPKPNLNQGAGLDVSPAVRDYLGLAGTDITDWRFVEAREVPHGPWAIYGDNNTVRRNGPRMASGAGRKPSTTATELAVARVP